jgi:hypothetical protein
MNKPNTVESVIPLSGEYSCKQDFRLNSWLLVASLMCLGELTFRRHIQDWSPFMRGLFSLSPFIPGLLYVRSWMRFVRSLDELQRRLQLEAFLFASLGTVIIGAAINSLAESSVSLGFLAHGLTLGGTFVSMIVLWTAYTLFSRSRYK